MSYRYGNVYGTVSDIAEGYYEASSLDDLRRYAYAALTRKTTVRAIGSRHSSSSVIETKGYVIGTDGLNKILNIDTKTGQVSVESGIKLEVLVNVLAQNGLALINQGHILKQSIAGVLGTATHGTGKTGTLSDSVISLTLVDGQAQVRTVSATDGDIFAAACCGVGAMGLIYSVVVQCYPLVMLRRTIKHTTIEDMLATYLQSIASNTHYEVFISTWLQPIVSELFYNATAGSTVPPANVSYLDFLKQHYRLDIANWDDITKLTEESKCWDGILTQARVTNLDGLHNTVLPTHQALSFENGLIPYIEMEVSIPIESLPQALPPIMEFCKGKPVQIMLRFTDADTKGVISPTYGRRSCYISFEVLDMKPEGPVKTLLPPIEKFLIEHHQGRPHWGKFFFHTALMASTQQDRLTRFRQAQLVIDPHGIFRNRWTTDFLGLAP